MTHRIAALSLLTLCLGARPAFAQNDLYDNGPINGTVDAWLLTYGSIVSDSFTIGAGGATVNGLSFGVWMFPGDDIHQGEVSITSSEFGGTTYFDGYVDFTVSNCALNQFGWNVCTETGSFGPINLNAGSYWLNLQHFDEVGDPLYWDENAGPSRASQNSVGTVPSESFTLSGTANGTTTTAGTAPEPGSIVLFGSAILGVAGLVRRTLL